MELGVALSAEELDPHAIVRRGRGRRGGRVHHRVGERPLPSVDRRAGESPFVWSVLGGIAQATEQFRVGTGVTCPTLRIHPAVIAQAAATTQCMFDGRFWFGVGSGEALNEHILGDRNGRRRACASRCWRKRSGDPALWTGEQTSHYGPHYRVENARIYTLPATLPKVIVSAFGRQSMELAARSAMAS